MLRCAKFDTRGRFRSYARLFSNQFKDSNALQQCLVSDPHHVTPGAQGEHIAEIQQALIMLGAAVIPAGEISTQRYGPSTARAVLAYKTKRQIINSAYQNTPDDIVGKKTIERLDLEMKKIEETKPTLCRHHESRRTA